ncbi:patatin family protein [Leptospira wolffii]|uniref:patatin-like phospholipase family protein n=1 Tax=Leptospira wolffii TaxID=409998 RepID=UPI001084099B|nr:patatin-like phospholipase family protein [Leptospira wolffii]TGK62012.1 patatin family protein [Leptospira wolffii]TGK68613.1 patatin family protein [Leptospira wolffii]TGK74603.1 patatin family protein [Leptospira wolffii]TGL31821.1 patatin family protein [Leptospira wolffii]
MQLPKFNKKRKGRALIIEGGGMRGSFAGGALASLASLHSPEEFDLVVAVSSGSCSAAYYVTQPNPSEEEIEQALDIWRVDLAGNRLISFWNLLYGKRILDQEYLIRNIFQEKLPIRTEVLNKKKTVPFYVALSSFESFRPVYLRATSENLFPLLKAATSLPIATTGFGNVEGGIYTDGGVLDPVPVEAVLDAGYKEITTVLTKPIHFYQKPTRPWFGNLAFPKSPEMGRMLVAQRHTMYNRAMQILKNPPNGIRFKIIAPETELPAGRMTTNAELLRKTVQLGIEQGKKILLN